MFLHANAVERTGLQTPCCMLRKACIKRQAPQQSPRGHLHTDRPTRLTSHLVRSSSDEDIPAVNDLIANNPQFASALQGALQRSGGKAALTKGARPVGPAEIKPSPGEEVLTHALRQSQRTIMRLERAQKELEEALQQEIKQCERIQFGLRRAAADAAFIRTLQKMRAQQNSQNGQY